MRTKTRAQGLSSALLPLAQHQGRPNPAWMPQALEKELQRGLEGQVLVQYMQRERAHVQAQAEQVQVQRERGQEQAQAQWEQVQVQAEQARVQQERALMQAEPGQGQVQVPLSL
ncbi:hypothetical protein B0H14DRAFT_3456077 [Mycena olivaceomarginata]|nr:hypothetical protein B0H14DRAFT_3456077 [Mycena olivaceomarginata]